MKKFLFVTIALIAFSCYSAHASPVPASVKYEQTIAKDVGYAPAVMEITSTVFDMAQTSDVYFPVNDAAADPFVVKTEYPRVATDASGPITDHYIYRHYFSHEDNKRYPEFKPKDPCNGFVRAIEVPVR